MAAGATAVASAGGAGCLSSDDEPEPDPVVETVERPMPELPERDPLAATPMPSGSDPSVSEVVENAGAAGTVHVHLTPLTEQEEGTYTGTTGRVEVVSLDAGERRTVTFEDVPASEYDAYRVDARSASITAVVRNRGEAGRVVVTVRSSDGASVHEDTDLSMEADETAELTFEGSYTLVAPERLDVQAAPAE